MFAPPSSNTVLSDIVQGSIFLCTDPCGGGFHVTGLPPREVSPASVSLEPRAPMDKGALHVLSSAHSQTPWVVLLGGRAYLTLALTDVGVGVGP